MFNKKLSFKNVLPDWCLGYNMDLAQSLLRLSNIQKDDRIFSPFSFVATKKSHIQEMMDESDIENTTCSFLLSNILPHPQGTKNTHRGIFVAAGQPFIPRTAKAAGDICHTQEYEANQMEFSCSVPHLPPLSLLLGNYRLVRTLQDYF